MAGKKKKFSYYNDYSTVNFGGSGRRSSGDSSRSRGARDHNWCQDCFGSGKCQHCKDGSYPRRDGSKATCGKCRGNLSCHACRGSRHGGKKCGTPTYEETVERNKQAPKRQSQPRSTWTPRSSQPPDTGVIAGTDRIVSFKTGGPTREETLITDGDYSDDNDGFRRDHDHYGPKGGTRRGKYTGPGS